MRRWTQRLTVLLLIFLGGLSCSSRVRSNREIKVNPTNRPNPGNQDQGNQGNQGNQIDTESSNCSIASGSTAKVFMATGIKIGEVDASSAIVWTRLTKHAERNKKGKKFTEGASELPEGKTIEDMFNSAVGVNGSVRVRFWADNNPQAVETLDWLKVDESTDHTKQFRLENLAADTKYHLCVEGRRPSGSEPEYALKSHFTTAPSAETTKKILFTMGTCLDYSHVDTPESGHKIFASMLKMNPNFSILAGDIVYYDAGEPLAKNITLARHKWNHTFALDLQREFYRLIPSYFAKDDHDTLKNDTWPGQNYGDLTFAQGLKLFREQVPMGPKTFRKFRWGKDLEIWLVEGRDFRSANNMEDGPNKTIWGKNQKNWFFDSFAKSDATFRILVSPTPILGPDRQGKRDSHANKGFKTEGDEVRAFLAQQKNSYVINGDRHWQYESTKGGIFEYGSGPASDGRAGQGRGLDETMLKFLRTEGGFLAVAVDPDKGKPTLTFSHYDVDGK